MPLAALVLLSAALASPQPRVWNDSIRDVYVDGKLERNVQTLTTSSPRMIAVVCGDEVMVFTPDAGTVSRTSKSAFTFAPDRVSATTPANLETVVSGSMVKPNDETMFALMSASDGKTMLVSAHQSKAGAMTLDELWETAPVWRTIADVYEPDGKIVDRLRAIDQPVTLQVVMATWCGDSRQHVPRLLKSIARANNPNITVELTGVGPDFTTPMAVVSGENITNVPTVIVRREGRELGRYVETPAAATIEDDVADIVAGTQKPHPSRTERGKLLRTGTYVLRRGRAITGTERFELYERPGGGVVAHSTIAHRNGTSTETWASLDADRKPRGVEVTHRGATTTRTRFRRNGDQWTAISRGASGGIIEQTVMAPDAFLAPATITYVWARGTKSAFVIPESGAGATHSIAYEIAAGEVPKFVKCADGTSRTLTNVGWASARP
ncbi:MAG TPA: thioredoxin family protein [Thermoanaerobaculia bacterium]|nr:thioredoxin family protein [Thermoanaerobaculia bacterium]